MNMYANMIRNLKTPQVMERLNHLYGNRDGMLVEQTARYVAQLKRHEELFHADNEVLLVSAPGRTEIIGNHTEATNILTGRKIDLSKDVKLQPRGVLVLSM